MSIGDFCNTRMKRLTVTVKPKKSFYKRYIEVLDKYKLRPADYPHFRHLIFKNESFRNCLLTDLTEYFLSDFAFGSKSSQNLIYELISKKGRGKTTNALILCKDVQVQQPKSAYHFVYSKETANTLIHDLPAHDTIVIDEFLRLTGKYSKTTDFNFDNLITMCRQFMKNFIFNVLQFTPMKNIDIYFETGGYDPVTKTSRLFWRDDDGSYLGCVYLKENFTPEEWKMIDEAKEQKWDKMSGDQGAHQVEGDFTEADVNKVVELIQGDPIYNKIYRVFDVRNYMRLKCKGSIPQHQIKDIASLVAAQLFIKRESEREKKREEREKMHEIGPYSVSEDPVLSWEDAKFRELVLQCLQKVLSPLQHKVFSEIIFDEKVRDIALRYFKTATNVKPVSEIRTEIQDKYLGVHGGEAAYKIMLQQQGKKFQYFGGNSSEPDFIVDSDREVISLKCYTQDIPGKAKNHIAAQEVNAALRLNYNLFLVTFSMKEAYFKKYRVSLPSLTETAAEPSEGGSGETASLETPLLSFPDGGQAADRAPASAEGGPCESRSIAKVAVEARGVSPEAPRTKPTKRRGKR
jgi:hypothetical protein